MWRIGQKEEDLLEVSWIPPPSLLPAHLPNSVCFKDAGYSDRYVHGMLLSKGHSIFQLCYVCK